MKSKFIQLIQALITFLQKFVPTEASKDELDFETLKSTNGKNSITINGISISTNGENISVINDKVYVDGKLIKKGLQGITKIEWSGPLANIDCTSLEVKGDVKGDIDATSVSVTGNVEGDVDGTSIKVGGNVGGDVDGTTVNVGSSSGKVTDRTRFRR